MSLYVCLNNELIFQSQNKHFLPGGLGCETNLAAYMGYLSLGFPHLLHKIQPTPNKVGNDFTESLLLSNIIRRSENLVS